MTHAIDLSGVGKRFGAVRALDGVTWKGGRQVVGVLGPNGAGKSTLLQMLGTVLCPDDGEVRIFGLDPSIPAERLEIRRQIGYLPQNAGLYNGFSAFDLVDYVAVLKEIANRDARRDEVRRVLAAVGLENDMHRRIRKLSGGMQRRVALAASMLGNPRLLVLDEPSAGIDPDHRLRLQTIIQHTRTHGTVIMSTHQTDEISMFCEHLLLLDRGRILFSGTPQDFTASANGRVWVDDHVDPLALRSWVTGSGETRNIGTPTSACQLVAPTVEDAYLLHISLTAELR